MSVLVVDAGNTEVKVVRWSGPWFFEGGVADRKPVVLGRVPTGLAGQAPDQFRSRMAPLLAGKDQFRALVSVVPTVTGILKGQREDLVEVGLATQELIEHQLIDAHTVGADRICNMVAAREEGLPDALVIDAGTATTFDLLLQGVYQGGLIAPGMASAAQNLTRQTAQLDEVPFQPMSIEVGRNTTEALMAGAWLVGRGGVEWTLDRLREKYGPLQVVVTGGLGRHLQGADRWWDPFWTLRGAAYAARSCG